MFFWGFLILWFISVFLGLYIRQLIKANYPEIFEQVYAKSFTEHSVGSSLRAIKFSFGGPLWQEIDDHTVLLWMQINRILGVGFYGVILSGFGYFFYIAIARSI